METTPSWKPIQFLDDQFPAFNTRAVANLQKIISETNAAIVLTTSHKSSYSIPQWKSIFNKRGLSVQSISRLNDNTNHLTRKDEILNWLQNDAKQPFVIIDDDTSLHDLPSAIKQKCVITSPLIGLTNEAALNAISILYSQKTASA